MAPAVQVEEQLTLDMKTGAKSKPARSATGTGEGEGYGRPKVCCVRYEVKPSKVFLYHASFIQRI